MRLSALATLIFGGALLLGCSTVAADDSAQTTTTGVEFVESIGSGIIPTVVIESPASGARAMQGEEYLILSTAIDTVGVTRVDLFVDGVLRRTDTTPEPGGRKTFGTLQPWIPLVLGQRDIAVVAYRADGTASDPATIVIEVVEDTLAPEPTPARCTARTVIELNVREGPGREYPTRSVLDVGQEVEVLGRNEGSFWWRIADGWIAAAYTTTEGDCTGLPLGEFDPPPPTATLEGLPAAVASGSAQAGSADLAVLDVNMPPRVTVAPGGGTSVTIEVIVANLGGRPSGVFRTAVFPTGQGGPGGRVDIPVADPLQPGESRMLATKYTYTSAGSFSALAVIDPNQQLGDADPRNNSRMLPVRVRAIAPSPTIDLNPERGSPGTPITVTGSGFPAGVPIAINYGTSQSNANARLVSGLVADADGDFVARFEVPRDWPDGSRIVEPEIVIRATTADNQWFAWHQLPYVR